MSRSRIVVFAVVLVSLVGTLLGRLGQVQLAEHEDYQQAAAVANTREVRLPAARGRILDASGEALVDNDSRPVVTLERSVLLDAPDGGRSLVARIAALLDLPEDRLWGRTQLCGTEDAPAAPVCWNGSPYQPIPLASGVDATRALSLLERPQDFPGVAVGAEPQRAYPANDRASAAQVLGYLAPANEADVDAGGGTVTDTDEVGRSGLERSYDEVLRGQAGTRTVAIDPRGVVTRTLDEQEPVPGRDVVTHLDLRVQQAAEQALTTAVAKARRAGEPADAAAAVVLDTTDGGVVASASYPAYDPAVWSGGISSADLARLTGDGSGTPLIDRVSGASFPPASTFKAISLPAALKAGNRLDGTYDCPDKVTIGGRDFRNFESRAYGPISLRKAITVSCDTVFYDLAYRSWQRLGGLSGNDARDPFVQEARSFGIGARTGIDLPGESGGLLPSRDALLATWEDTRGDTCKRARTGYPEVARDDAERAAYLKALAVENCRTGGQYRAGDAVNAAIGQGDVAASPLQMARAYTAIANGGTLWVPQVADRYAAGGGSPAQDLAPVAERAIEFDPAVLPYLRGALRSVVSEGTAAGAFAGFPLARYPVAGKTGTAEVFGQEDTAWFVSYGPATTPRYAVAVVIARAGTGGAVAAPAARQIWDTLRMLPAPAGSR